jgi:mono/diheme cytochrome c family protein
LPFGGGLGRGADALVALVESGHASPRLLLAPSVSAKLATLKSEALNMRVAALTSKLPPASETLDKLILERRVAFAKATPNLEKGLAVFTKHCAACHQIAGKGAVVGPQLDGIASRLGGSLRTCSIPIGTSMGLRTTTSD